MIHRTVPRLACAAMLTLGILACVRPMPIAQVRQRAAELDGKQVVVAGEVAEAVELPLLRDHYYQVDDGTERIWVQTAQPVPAKGQHVQVTGTLGPGLKVPGIEAGLVIVESQRQ